MNKMMTFDPQKRITPQQAVKHPYFDGFNLSAQLSQAPEGMQASTS